MFKKCIKHKWQINGHTKYLTILFIKGIPDYKFQDKSKWKFKSFRPQKISQFAFFFQIGGYFIFSPSQEFVQIVAIVPSSLLHSNFPASAARGNSGMEWDNSQQPRGRGCVAVVGWSQPYWHNYVGMASSASMSLTQRS